MNRVPGAVLYLASSTRAQSSPEPGPEPGPESPRAALGSPEAPGPAPEHQAQAQEAQEQPQQAQARFRPRKPQEAPGSPDCLVGTLGYGNVLRALGSYSGLLGGILSASPREQPPRQGPGSPRAAQAAPQVAGREQAGSRPREHQEPGP